jgi:hypothetical protein
MRNINDKRRVRQPPANLALIIQNFSQRFSPMVRRASLQVTSHLTDLRTNLTSSE